MKIVSLCLVALFALTACENSRVDIPVAITKIEDRSYKTEKIDCGSPIAGAIIGGLLLGGTGAIAGVLAGKEDCKPIAIQHKRCVIFASNEERKFRSEVVSVWCSNAQEGDRFKIFQNSRGDYMAALATRFEPLDSK